MAASQEEDGGDGIDNKESADDGAEGLGDIEAQISQQFEAIEADGEKLTGLIKHMYIKVGVNAEAKDGVRVTVHELINELIDEHDQVTLAEVTAGLWSELLLINHQLAAAKEAAADAESESDTAPEGDLDSDTKQGPGDLETFGPSGTDTDDDEVEKSEASMDPAFQ